MTSLVPASYLITVKQKWPLDGGLTASRAKHLTHDQAEQLDSGAQTGPSGCIRASLFTGLTSWHQCLVKGIEAYACYIGQKIQILTLTGTHLGDINLELKRSL